MIHPEFGHETAQAEYLFVLCKHTAENIDRIAACLESCDTVLLETVGQSAADATDNFEIFNAMTLGLIPREMADSLARANIKNRDDLDGHFGLLLAYALYGSDTLLWPIDMPSDHPHYPKIAASHSNLQQYWRGIKRGTFTLDKSLSELSTVIEEEAAAVALRERLVDRQIPAFIPYLPEGRGQKIGIVQGAVHTYQYQQMQQRGEHVRRVFIDDKELTNKVKMIFPYAETAVRFKRFNPEEPLPRELLEKILIEGITMRSLDFDEEDFDAAISTLRTEFIEGMDTEARSSFLYDWDKLISGTTRGRKRRISTMVADYLSKYCEVEIV